MIALQLKDHVAIPLRWKDFQFPRRCPFDVKSILEAEPMAGGKESEEGRQTVFFTSLDPSVGETEEEFNNDMSRPKKWHYERRRKRIINDLSRPKKWHYKCE